MTTATVGKKNPKYKWEVLALLWVAYLLNQADRQVFNVVLPLIREDLGLSDVAIGSIATVLNLFYAVLGPIGGLVGDHLLSANSFGNAHHFRTYPMGVLAPAQVGRRMGEVAHKVSDGAFLWCDALLRRLFL